MLFALCIDQKILRSYRTVDIILRVIVLCEYSGVFVLDRFIKSSKSLCLQYMYMYTK